MLYDPVRLRTVARFSSEDPWSQNQLTHYTIEEYVMIPAGSTRALDSKWSLRAIGIHWESDHRYRLLPESLVELWKHGRLPSEKLPSLLHAVEHRLIEADCVISQGWRRSFGIPMLAMLVVCPAVCLLVRVDGRAMPVTGAIGLGLVLALLIGVILWMAKSMKRDRAQQQMTWAINQLSGGSSAGPYRNIKSALMVFLAVWIKLCTLLIALALLTLCGAAIYFKLYG